MMDDLAAMSNSAESETQSLVLVDLADESTGLAGWPARMEVTRSSTVEVHALSSAVSVRVDAALVAETWRVSPDVLLFRMRVSEGIAGGDIQGNGTIGKSFLLKSLSSNSRQYLDMLQKLTRSHSDAEGHFQRRTETASADLYFHYYGLLQHQQNMLQDMIRTGLGCLLIGTYYAAIMGNFSDFQDKVVMDVGAGSGILSLFAAQAGARMVYAVEASDMAGYCRRLAAANPHIGDRIKVLHSKVEDLDMHGEKVDILISEPMGTLLVNERMLETYLYARDHFLKPNGRMFPQSGRIYCAAFTDDALFSEMAHKATFWQQTNFFGVDLSTLHAPAVEGYFSQVVVDAVDPRCLVCQPVCQHFDFGTVMEQELHDITLKLQFPAGLRRHKAPVHSPGHACDTLVRINLRRDNAMHRIDQRLNSFGIRFQLRCVMTQPLTVFPGAEVFGTLKLVAHARQSYDIFASLGVKSISPHAADQQVTGKFDLKEPYYRQLTGSWWQSPSSQCTEGPSNELPGCIN